MNMIEAVRTNLLWTEGIRIVLVLLVCILVGLWLFSNRSGISSSHGFSV